MSNKLTAKQQWKKLYRSLRVARREAIKASIDSLLYGTGIVICPSDGSDVYRVHPRNLVIHG